jgi:PAS domain S-box-containing protein
LSTLNQAATEVRDEAVYRLLIDAITDYAIYMLDPNGIVTHWNPGAERIKGYSAAEILGQHFSKFYTEEDRSAGLPQRALETAAREGRYEREGWRVRKDGTRLWANVVIDAIRDQQGQLIGFAKITRDVTERMNAQRALEQAREQLFQAQKMESIGQLTGGIAHDFNNLLAAVMGSLELLRKRIPDDPKTQRLIDNAVMGAERGISLTKRMIMFARRQELKPTGVDLAKVVGNLRELLEPSLGPLVTLETRFPPDLRPAHTDRNQIETAILNLVVNARDAMPEGGKIVISGAERRFARGEANMSAGDYVALIVSDSGVGMDAETLARAAEPFFTTKGIGKGTGLGLSMVHGLAEQSGGKLILKSKPGRGTTAELWLPRSSGVAAPEQPVAPPASDVSAALRILAVDDDPLVLMNTAAMLEDLGHSVLEAHSAAEALDILRDGRAIDVVITDHAMPQMTGAELAQVLQRERPALPVVMATGYAELPVASPTDAIRLTKPFRQQDLADVLAQVRSARERA